MAEQEDRHWWFAGRRAIIESLLKRDAAGGEKRRILEVGCGTGGNLALLQSLGAVDAAEYDGEARALAARKSGLAISPCALPDSLPAQDGSYDLVVLLDVLEHVEQDVASLQTIRTKLKPGGRVLITVPALPWLWSAHDETHHHFRRYTKATLRATAEAAGLAVVGISYFSTLLFPLIAGTRLLKRAMGLRSVDEGTPGPLVNAFLKAIFVLERRLVGRVPLPIGSSLVLIAR